MKTYITGKEQERCRRAAEAFSELYEKESIVALDAGGYGFVVLQYYSPQSGFDDMHLFTNGRELFEYLWREWLDAELFSLAKGTAMIEMDYEDICKSLPKEKQKELMGRRLYFAKKAGLHENG